MTEKESEIPPDTCPLIESCEDSVTGDEFEGLCDSDNWIHCMQKEAGRLSAKYRKKPREWCHGS